MTLGALRERLKGGTKSPSTPIESQTRRIHVGVDFGTTFSKLVARDLLARGGESMSFLARYDGMSVDPLIPSLVAVDDDRIWFGFDAEERRASRTAKVYSSLKMRAAFPDNFFGREESLPDLLSAVDLVTLSVTFLLQVALRSSRRYCDRLGVSPQVSMTLGVPVAYLDHPVARGCYFDIATTAYCLFRRSNIDFGVGPTLATVRSALRDAKRGMPPRAELGEISDWLRPEALSALLWVYRSPEVGEGLYASVDVGGGTTNSTFFTIVDTMEDGYWRKDAMAFFGACTRPPGMDKIDAVLVSCTDADPTSVRGQESALLANAGDETRLRVKGVVSEVFATYQRAFRDSYLKDSRQRQWEKYDIFLVGGGSKLTDFSRALQVHPVPGWENAGSIRDPGVPSDLCDEDGSPFDRDPTFFLVAYGLSYPVLEIPRWENPRDIPPLKIELKPANRCVYYEEYDQI